MMLDRGLIPQARQVVLIHSQDVMEAFEVFVADPPCANAPERHTASLGSRCCPPVRRFADVIGVRAG